MWRHTAIEYDEVMFVYAAFVDIAALGLIALIIAGREARGAVGSIRADGGYGFLLLRLESPLSSFALLRSTAAITARFAGITPLAETKGMSAYWSTTTLLLVSGDRL